MAHRILRLPDVLDRCGLSRSSLYALMAQSAFPNSIPISTRSVGWLESDIEAWVEARLDRRLTKSEQNRSEPIKLYLDKSLNFATSKS